MPFVWTVGYVAIRDLFRPRTIPARPEIASPWTPDPSHLAQVQFAELYGLDGLESLVTRTLAMSIPASAKARNLICSAVSKCPLTLRRDDVELETPGWMVRESAGVAPYHRMVWTVDDLYHYGWSLWSVMRGAPDPRSGRADILQAYRVPFEWWDFDPDGNVQITEPDAAPYYPAADEVVLIPGSHEGILSFGRVAIRHARDLNRAALKAAENPSAYLDLHYTGEKPLTEPEINALVARWVKARRGDNGGVGFTNKFVEARELGSYESHLMIEARNAASVDIARVAGLPAALLDATNATASLTYETTAGRNAEFIDYGLSPYLDPIAARLSMDDVVPAGQSVRFDTTELRTMTPNPAAPATED